MKKLILLTLFCLSLVGLPFSNSSAIPELQLYVEGATYDPLTQTWITGVDPFTLWVIGNVGAKGTIYDVNLIAAYPTSETGGITFSVPTEPVLGTGDPPSPLPPHAPYGTGTSWNVYPIGDFTSSSDFIQNMTDPADTGFGQINKYVVTVEGYSWVHFDAYNHTLSPAHAWFSPGSHDSEFQVPESGILILLGIAMSAVGIASRYIRKI